MAPADTRPLADRLLQWFEPLQSCVVAFSGGVDSVVVAKAAHLALGSRATAVTGNSASLAEGELDGAIAAAREIGIRHDVIATHEFDRESYLRNAPDRCFHCKTELYGRLQEYLLAGDAEVILNGANADDVGDYRPGMRAAADHRVRSPLLECGFTKADVRSLASEWKLTVWDKPAAPCLSSRVAYGEEVTPARLAMIDQAERFLRERGWRQVRVRYHRGDLARIEVPREEVARLLEPDALPEIEAHLRSVGFKFVTVDLSGFRSGSLNSVLSAETQLVALRGPSA